jgi:hypothetical protein
MTRTSANPTVGGGGRQQFLQRNDDQTPVPQVPIKAVLSGTRHCSALSISVNAYTPVLTLARQLIRAGIRPDQLLEVYRGSPLCFRVPLVTAARLTVKDGPDGRPSFRQYEQSWPVDPPIASNDPAGTSARLDITKPFPEPHPKKRDGLREAGRRRRLAGV